MGGFYKKAANLYEVGKPWKLSRAKIELYNECKRCFYLDRKVGIARPPGFPFNLNSCVDALLKKEFDGYRVRQERHPIMPEGMVPLSHPMMEIWRQNFKGVQYHHKATNFIITGAVDDLWIDSAKQIAVVDYKSTSKKEKIVALDQDWHGGYKRQMEIYQWLLRQCGEDVADTGYFVYCNGDSSKPSFNKKIEFDITLIPHIGNDEWVEGMIMDIHTLLNQSEVPALDPKSDCDYCKYLSMCANLK